MMISKIFSPQLIIILFLVGGIACILLSILWADRLKSSLPIKIKIEKFGIDLNLQTLSFVILVGFLMVASGGIFFFQEYESRLDNYENDLSKSRSKTETLQATLDKFDEFDIKLKLDFPEGDYPNPKNTILTSFVYRKNVYDTSKPYNRSHPLPANQGGMTVEVSGLKPEDRVFVTAEEIYGEQTIEWKSETMYVPNALLKMKRQK